MRLLPWQKALILALFELRADGLRRFRWALIGVPKKNGKTELAAALALYFLIGDGEPAPLVVCAAASDEQADLVFGAAKTMCELSPRLRAVTAVWDREIEVPSLPGAKLVRVAAVAGTNDGKNIHAVICDELHEWKPGKGEQVWNVLTNGTGARDQPMVLQITTAGFDIERTVCGQQYQLCRRIESGEEKDDRYFFYWVQADENADHRDPASWEAANPSYGVTVGPDFFLDQLKKKPEAVFRRYFLNQWTASGEAWVPTEAYDALARPEVAPPEFGDVWLGVDIGLRDDHSALVAIHPREGQPAVIRCQTWVPPENGELDLALVEQAIRDYAGRYRVRMIAYDKFAFARSAQMLSNEGLPMEEFGMSAKPMALASRLAFQAITGGEWVHDGDPVLRAHVLAGEIRNTEYGWRLVKNTRTGRKIDALIALVIAWATYSGQGEDVNPYETRGLLSF